MTQTVDALVTAGAEQAVRARHHRAPRPAPARRGDRHRVRRHLPLRHPPGPRGVGRGPVPDGARPRDRRRGLARSAPRSRSTQVGDRVGVGCFVDSCRECENCKAGEEQYCLAGEVATYNGTGYDGEPTFGGYSTPSSSTRTTCSRIPEGIGARRRRAAAVRRHHALLAAQALGCRPGQARSPSSAWAASATWACKIAHALGAEVTVLSQSLSKQEDGMRLGADHYYATSDAQTFEDAARHAST